jgi:alkanesulfonate monooxygenase SsuD/methylene tetrahydromethanopterin reductase-like flavin-dependent oxidoreductase (luciferase family)
VHRDEADIEGARNVVRLNVPNSQSADWESIDMQRIIEGMIGGFFSLPLVGTPDQIVQRILDLHAVGLDGIALSWPNFDEGLEQTERDLLPRLVQAGVRKPVDASTPALARS